MDIVFRRCLALFFHPQFYFTKSSAYSHVHFTAYIAKLAYHVIRRFLVYHMHSPPASVSVYAKRTASICLTVARRFELRSSHSLVQLLTCELETSSHPLPCLALQHISYPTLDSCLLNLIERRLAKTRQSSVTISRLLSEKCPHKCGTTFWRNNRLPVIHSQAACTVDEDNKTS